MPEDKVQGKFTILVADDREYIRNLVRARLASQPSYTVLEASDGRQALELVKLHRPDILLTDWLMPEIDGLGLCRMVRDLDLPDYIYIIILTAKEEQKDIVGRVGRRGPMITLSSLSTNPNCWPGWGPGRA